MQIAILLRSLVDVYTLVILARVILSWVSLDRRHPFVEFIERLTEPLLGPLRSLIGIRGGLDFSPLLALLLLSFVRRILMRLFT